MEIKCTEIRDIQYWLTDYLWEVHGQSQVRLKGGNSFPHGFFIHTGITVDVQGAGQCNYGRNMGQTFLSKDQQIMSTRMKNSQGPVTRLMVCPQDDFQRSTPLIISVILCTSASLT